jgi:ABC-type oligopeptide transport system ATPase subunit
VVGIPFKKPGLYIVELESTILGEALGIHHNLKGKAAKERMRELLEAVGMSAEHIPRFPHEFSGGQRQRIGVPGPLPCICGTTAR